MESERLYYQDPYRKEIDATVVGVQGTHVILDKTICYPEGGGQPGDRGSIGPSHILDTQKGEHGEIVHVVDNPSFQVGERVHVTLDWSWRSYFMRVHTAQHMISGILFNSHHIGTLSVHQGEEILTIECDRECVEEELCYQVEDEVNQAVREGHSVHYEEMTRKEALSRGLRRSIKVDGDDIRLVVIEGVDEIACGGLHVANTREVGLVQYVGQEKIRSHARLIFRVGHNASQEIRLNRSLVAQLNAVFSTQCGDLLSVARNTFDECHALKAEISRLKGCIAKSDWDSLPAGVVTLDVTDKPYGLKDLAGAIDGREDRAVLAVQGEHGSLRWMLVCSGKYHDFDFNANRTRLLGPVSGKGGGRAPLYQGSAEGDKETLFGIFQGLFS